MPASTRKKQLLLLVFAALWGGIAFSVTFVGWTPTWRPVVINTETPPFLDMRTVQAGLEARAMGLNPQVENPTDPFHRPMNYPLVWLAIADGLQLGSRARFDAYVGATVLIYLACCARILWMTGSIWTLAMMFSASALLAVERGNNDIVVFSLLFLALAGSRILAVPAVLLAVALKIYPVLAVPAFFRHRIALLTLATGSALILFLTWPQFGDIRAGIPGHLSISYGSRTLEFALADKLGVHVPRLLISTVMLLGAVSAFPLLGGVEPQSAPGQGTRCLDMFYAGTLVYLGTFVLESNFDYRLIVLFLCLPHVLTLNNSAVRVLVLSTMLLTMHQPHLSQILGTAGKALNMGAKCLLFVLLGALALRALQREATPRRHLTPA